MNIESAINYLVNHQDDFTEKDLENLNKINCNKIANNLKRKQAESLPCELSAGDLLLKIKPFQKHLTFEETQLILNSAEKFKKMIIPDTHYVIYGCENIFIDDKRRILFSNKMHEVTHAGSGRFMTSGSYCYNNLCYSTYFEELYKRPNLSYEELEIELNYNES